MTATNHALTGALIGLAIGNPVIAIPLAFASHFVLDAIPHYGGLDMTMDEWMQSRKFKYLMIFDILGCVSLVAILAFFRPEHWLLASFCAFTATSVDLSHIPLFLLGQKNKSRNFKHSWFTRFHYFVQWYEKPIGAFVEVIFMIGAAFLLASTII